VSANANGLHNAALLRKMSREPYHAPTGGDLSSVC